MSETYEVPVSAISIARLLGLQPGGDFNDLDLVEKVESGLPVVSVERVARRLDPNNPALKYEIVPRSSLARFKKTPKRRLTKNFSERVYAMAKVANEALALWGEEDAATRFLTRPHPLLGGRTPLDVARESSAGAELVVNLINRARAGVAV